MQSCRVMALLIGALSVCSCDLIVDKIREGASGNAPGGGSSSGPTPPSLPTSDAAAPPVLPPQPPSRCQDWTGAGDETTCKTQDDWKRYAHDACQAQNLILNDYGVGGGDCGAGMTRMVKYQCCAPVPVPPDPGNTPGTSTPGTGATGSGGACTGGSEGGTTSCKSVATWRQYATENCARQNLVLSDIGFGESCGTDFYRYMKFVCCSGK